MQHIIELPHKIDGRTIIKYDPPRKGRKDNGRVDNIRNLLINGLRTPDKVWDKIVGLDKTNSGYGVRSIIDGQKEKMMDILDITIGRTDTSPMMWYIPQIPEFKGCIKTLCNTLGISSDIEPAHRHGGGKTKGSLDLPHQSNVIKENDNIISQMTMKFKSPRPVKYIKEETPTKMLDTYPWWGDYTYNELIKFLHARVRKLR